jgi:uncharacterized protein YegL
LEPQGTIIPVYFVADQSGSMAENMSELNEGLTSLLDSLQKQPFAAAKVRFSVIGFSDTAHTYMEPSDLRSVSEMPTLQPGGMTSYAAAFNELLKRISIDVPALKAQGYAVIRPVAFFLTDGLPNANEDWRAARTSLLNERARPNIVAFGIGQADAAIVAEIATKPEHALVAIRGADTGEALNKFFDGLTQSVISSGQAVASGSGELQMERPEGFSLAVDIL